MSKYKTIGTDTIKYEMVKYGMKSTTVEVVEGNMLGDSIHFIMTYNKYKESIVIHIIDDWIENPNGAIYNNVFMVTMENSWNTFKDHKIMKNVSILFNVLKSHFKNHGDSIIMIRPFFGLHQNHVENIDDKYQITVTVNLEDISDEITLDVPYVGNQILQNDRKIERPPSEESNMMIEEFRRIEAQFEELQKKCEKMTQMIEALEQTKMQSETLQKKFEILIKLSEDSSNQIKLIK